MEFLHSFLLATMVTLGANQGKSLQYHIEKRQSLLLLQNFWTDHLHAQQITCFQDMIIEMSIHQQWGILKCIFHM